MTAFPARLERFDHVVSTNDVVRDWLAAGSPEVCVAVAREQTAGRGRAGRRWVAPPGAALLVSLGFRPGWLAPDAVWRLAAVASLAMADAAEEVAGLDAGTVRLKWPNDLVIAMGTATGGNPGNPGRTGGDHGGDLTDRPIELRKLAGVLGETDGLGSDDPRAVVGLGVNSDWAAVDFPRELAASMTSLREAAGGRAIDLDDLLDGFLARLAPRIEALRGGVFDGAGWSARQVTTGRMVRLEAPGGAETVRALGVDASTGALIVADPTETEGDRHVVVGEITHVRLVEPIAAGV